MSEPPSSVKHGPQGSMSEVVRLAVPMALSAGVQSLMHVVDRLFLLWQSQEAAAASMPAGMVFWTFFSIAYGTAQYANTFVAQYHGAGRPERVLASVWQGVYFSLFGGAGLMLLALVATPLFNWVGHHEPVQSMEIIYFRICCLGGIPAVLMTALSCYFSGQGKMTVVFLVNLGSVLVNAGLDWLLIFGTGPFPAWGIAGAAIATQIANLCAVIAYAVLIVGWNIEHRTSLWKASRFDSELMWRLLKYGVPSGFQIFIDVGGFTAFLIIVGRLGEAALTATNVAFSLNSLAFTPVSGCGLAVSTLVGQAIGAGRADLAERVTYRGFFLAEAYMMLFAVVYLVFPEQLLTLHGLHANPETFNALKQTVIVLLRFVAIYSLFDAMAIVFGGAIRGAGDTLFATVFIALCSWGLLVIPTWVAWSMEKVSLELCWTFCAIYVIILGLGFFARFRQGRWKSMTVIEPNLIAEG